jgi:hypothetical protein
MARRIWEEGCGRASCFCSLDVGAKKGPDFLSLKTSKTYFAKQSSTMVQYRYTCGNLYLARRRTWCAHTTCIYIQYSRQYP